MTFEALSATRGAASATFVEYQSGLEFPPGAVKDVIAIIEPKPDTKEPKNLHQSAAARALLGKELGNSPLIEQSQLISERAAQLLQEREAVLAFLKQAQGDLKARNSEMALAVMDEIQHTPGLGNCTLDQAVILLGRRLNVMASGDSGTYRDDLGTYAEVLAELEDIPPAVPVQNVSGHIIADAITIVPLATPELVNTDQPLEGQKRKEELARQIKTALTIIRPTPDLQHPLFPHQAAIARELLGSKLTSKTPTQQEVAVRNKFPELQGDRDLIAIKLERACQDPEYQNSDEIQTLMSHIHQTRGLELCTVEQAAKLVKRNLYQRPRGERKTTYESDLKMYTQILKEIAAAGGSSATGSLDLTSISVAAPLTETALKALVDDVAGGEADSSHQAEVVETEEETPPVRVGLAVEPDGTLWQPPKLRYFSREGKSRRGPAFGYKPSNPDIISFSPDQQRFLLFHYLPNNPRDNFAYPTDEELAEVLGLGDAKYLQPLRESLQDSLNRLKTAAVTPESVIFFRWLNDQPEYQGKGPEVLTHVLYRTITFDELKDLK